MPSIRTRLHLWTLTTPMNVMVGESPAIVFFHYEAAIWRQDGDGHEILTVTAENGESREFDLWDEEHQGVPVCSLVRKATEQIPTPEE